MAGIRNIGLPTATKISHPHDTHKINHDTGAGKCVPDLTALLPRGGRRTQRYHTYRYRNAAPWTLKIRNRNVRRLVAAIADRQIAANEI